MLARPIRLSRGEIEEIVKRGRRLEGQSVALRYLGGSGASQFAIIVSKKTAKLAVRRNLLKRRVRHILRQPKHPLPPQIKAVIFLKPPAARLDFTELEAETLKIFNKIGK